MKLNDEILKLLETDEKYKSILGSVGEHSGSIDAFVRAFVRDVSGGFEKLLEGLENDAQAREALFRSLGVKGNDER